MPRPSTSRTTSSPTPSTSPSHTRSGSSSSARACPFQAAGPWSATPNGVADEEPGGFLEPNKIYGCVHELGKEPVYLTGLVAISCSPCIHPGDVQMVRAVGQIPDGKAPRITTQQDCVVFSARGARPLPSRLGGGALDGDMFQLITLPELLPELLPKRVPKRVHPPGECTRRASARRPSRGRSSGGARSRTGRRSSSSIRSCRALGRSRSTTCTLPIGGMTVLFSAECLELARKQSVSF